MKKRIILVLAALCLLAGSAFAQKTYKHWGGDMLIGADLGLGATTNLFKSFNVSDGAFKEGNYAGTISLGVHFDYYLNYWLSFNTGVRTHFGVYVFLDRDFQFNEDTKITDIAKTPLALTVPFNVHVNVPFAQWLYAGVGVNLNFPLLGVLDNVKVPSQLGELDTKGSFFIGVPIDLGFDFIPAGHGGIRFFLRATPEFHEGKTVVPIGFVWQIFNIKIR